VCSDVEEVGAAEEVGLCAGQSCGAAGLSYGRHKSLTLGDILNHCKDV
jgi:hypothetical protein